MHARTHAHTHTHTHTHTHECHLLQGWSQEKAERNDSAVPQTTLLGVCPQKQSTTNNTPSPSQQAKGCSLNFVVTFIIIITISIIYKTILAK